MFDEPLANLDPVSSLHTVELIKDIHKQYNKTIVIIEHRIEEMLNLDLDKIILIDGGEIVAIGTPEKILASNILPSIGLREPMYIEGLKRLHFDSNNDVIYPLENLQMENVSGVINEWMEKQTFVKILLQKRIIENRGFVILIS